MTPTPLRAYATVTGPTAIFTTPDGHREHVTTAGDIRAEVVRRATTEARRTGTPVELVTSGDHGDHHLLITTDGTLTPLPTDTDVEDSRTPEVPESDSPNFRGLEPPHLRTPEPPYSRSPKLRSPGAVADALPAAPRT